MLRSAGFSFFFTTAARMYTRGPAAERASRIPQVGRRRKPGARAQRRRPGPALRAGVAEPGHGPSTARRVCLPAEPLLSLRVPAHLSRLVSRHAVPEAVEEDCRLRLEDCGADLLAQKVRGNAHRRLRRAKSGAQASASALMRSQAPSLASAWSDIMA